MLADGRTALHHAAGARVREHRAEQAGKVDTEMLVEPPVLGGERRLDQVVGELVERDCVVVADAARAQFIAVTVEEGDRELGLLQPIVVGGFTEGRDRKRQQHQKHHDVNTHESPLLFKRRRGQDGGTRNYRAQFLR